MDGLCDRGGDRRLLVGGRRGPRSQRQRATEVFHYLNGACHRPFVGRLRIRECGTERRYR